ncbi:hypothetical protein MMC22_001667 [Lobaria immixta]|nr:hypothetical protein [Lobaria immixta]
MADPFTLITAGASYAVSATKFIADLASVKDDTNTIIRQLKVITSDVVEAVKLRHQNIRYLSEAQKQRVDWVIQETNHALNKIKKHVEPARRGVAKSGTVNMVDRVDWVLRRSASVEAYQHSLNACQISLQGQINILMASRNYAAQSTPRTPVDEEAEDSVSDGDDDEQTPIPSTQLGGTSDGVEHRNQSPNSEAPAPKELHSERVWYEDIQRLHNPKRRIAAERVHPERERYEQMQQNSSRKKRP